MDGWLNKITAEPIKQPIQGQVLPSSEGTSHSFTKGVTCL